LDHEVDVDQRCLQHPQAQHGQFRSSRRLVAMSPPLPKKITLFARFHDSTIPRFHDSTIESFADLALQSRGAGRVLVTVLSPAAMECRPCEPGSGIGAEILV